jgi:hypothetical protein
LEVSALGELASIIFRDRKTEPFVGHAEAQHDQQPTE